jgi:hypothetical protein
MAAPIDGEWAVEVAKRGVPGSELELLRTIRLKLGTGGADD